MPVVTMPTSVLVSVNQKLNPVQRRKIHKNGKVKRSRLRRPHLSIVKRAGIAKTLCLLAHQPAKKKKKGRGGLRRRWVYLRI